MHHTWPVEDITWFKYLRLSEFTADSPGCALVLLGICLNTLFGIVNKELEATVVQIFYGILPCPRGHTLQV